MGRRGRGRRHDEEGRVNDSEALNRPIASRPLGKREEGKIVFGNDLASRKTMICRPSLASVCLFSDFLGKAAWEKISAGE